MIFAARLRGAAALLVLSAVWAPAWAAENAPYPPALARPPANAEVSLAYFEQRLTPFGHWISHPVWGQVWQPDTGRDFRPYFYGYWQYTGDYGWLWVSNEPYGDIVYHYGRWVYDPNFGWLWVPGYVWGPSWVAWRETDDGYIGWLPMPPGYQDFSLGAQTPSYGPGDLYGYQYFYGSNFTPEAFTGLWVFVPGLDFARSDRRPYVIDKDRVRDLFRRSQDRTHYLQDRDRDRIVDRSIDKDELERATHRRFAPQAGRQFLRADTPIVPLTQGQEIDRRERGGDRGRGAADRRANEALQNVFPDATGSLGAGAVRRPALTGPPASGRGSPFPGRPDAPQAPGRSGTVPNTGAAIPGAGPPDALLRPRGARRPPTGRDSSTAVGATALPAAPNIPSTDGFPAGRSSLPGLGPQAGPQLGRGPAATIPGRELGGARLRRFGLGVAPTGPASGAAVPPLAAGLPPAAVLRPAPVLQPSSPIPPVPAAQPGAPAPILSVPQAVPLSPQRSPLPAIGARGRGF